MKKKTRSTPHHPLRQVLALFLTVLLAFSAVLPALADESPEMPESTPSQTSSAAPESSEVSGDFPSSQEPPLRFEPSPSPEASPTPAPTPEIKKYKVTFAMGALGTKEYLVEENTYLSEMPEDPFLPEATFLGWFDKKGQQVYPQNEPVTADVVYTARFYRLAEEFLNTTDHSPYVKGYENGMFKPNNTITRGEAAQMVYTLLRNKTYEPKTFSDVPTKAWYYDAVGIMARLGVVQGYADGTFLPTNKITRAEFIKMVVSCDTLEEAKVSFWDVPATSWAAPYIATAAQRGWIEGFPDDTFKPNDQITRVQAVTILNRVLGRIPSATLKTLPDTKNFFDVFSDHWAYGQILEAANNHSYFYEGEQEVWPDYEKDTTTVSKSGWVVDGKDRYYLDAKTRKFLRGEVTIDGKKYLLDSSTGKAFTGFKPVGSFTRYYKDGLMMEDISGLGVVSGPYFIKVYKPANYLIIFAKDANGKYTIPVRSMLVSCGYGTPTGTFYTPDRYRWLQMVGDTYAQWCTQIMGNYLFHSVPNWTYNNFDLEVDEYNHLGDTRSLGCIRLNCRDAKWIFDNCVLGTEVFISAVETSGPLGKPQGLKIPSWHSWDPTDPTAYYRCRQVGCH